MVPDVPSGGPEADDQPVAGSSPSLVERNRIFREIAEMSPVDMMIIEGGTITYLSDGVADLLGYTSDEVVGEPFARLTVEENGANTDEEWLNTVLSDSAGDLIHIAGERRELEIDDQSATVYFIQDSSHQPSMAQDLDRYRALVKIPDIGIYHADRSGRLRMVNDAIVERLGYARDELIGKSLSSVTASGELTDCETDIEALQRGEMEVLTIEFQAKTASGERFPCEAHLTAIPRDGSEEGTVGMVRDISDRKERAEELRQERGLIEHVLETSPIGIGVITPDGDISRVNDRAEELLGLTMEELSDQTFDASQRKLYDSEGHQVSPADLLRRVFDEREQVIDTEFTLERPDGDQVWASISIAPMTNAVGDVAKAAIIATDITDRKTREEALREERDLIEHILETSPVAIGVISPEGDISRVNDRAERLFGLTDYELSTQTLDVSQRELYDSTGRRIPAEDLLGRVFADQERVMDNEVRLENPDGGVVWISISIAPIESRGGAVDKAVIIGKEITERKAREETLRDERDVIEHILATSPVGIGVITPDGDISRVNDQAEELLGLTIEEITNQTLDVSQRKFYGASGQQVQPEDLLSRVFDDGERVLNSEFRLERPDGERVWTALSIAPVENADGHTEKGVVIATDISERKKREKRLRESEARLRQIAENINSAIWMADADMSEVLYINPAYEEITGRSRDSVYNNLMSHVEAVHPQDSRRVESAMKEVTHSIGNDESRIRFQEKYRVVEPDGSVNWVNSFAFPLQDDDGEVYRFVGLIDDITEVKEQQLELGRQRDELETLNQINTVIRRLNQGIVQSSSRVEIERQACDTLTDSKLYHVAWIGEIDTGRPYITPKTGEGLDPRAYEESFGTDAVDAIELAVTSGEVQIIRNISDLPPELAGIDHLEQDGGQPSAAVIPLRYKETVYDVLVAYSSRANAFSVREQAVLFELGKTIGLAINAVERKEALLSDSVVELKFRIVDPNEFFVRVSAELEGAFEMRGITPQSDGTYVQYYAIRGGSHERLVEFARRDDAIDNVRVVTEPRGDESEALLEFVVEGQSPAGVIAEYGGAVQSAAYRDGEGTIITEYPHHADIGAAVDAMESSFTNSELLSKQERERTVDTDEGFHHALANTLTERQFATLTAAYYAGYFEWPRDSSGEDVAESLDVAPATFHQHIREGLQKLVETFIEKDSPE